MAVFLGTTGDDNLQGTADRDLFFFLGGQDIYDGGDGNDEFTVNNRSQIGGSLTAIGGQGADQLLVTSLSYQANVTFSGGADNDNAFIIFANETSNFILDMGEGDDLVSIGKAFGNIYTVSGQFDVTLGSGQDVVLLGELTAGLIIIRDFVTGNNGDILSVVKLHNFTNWDGEANLFTTGHLDLRQDGADTILRVDYDGSGSGEARDFVRFNGTQVADFTTVNFGGMPPNGSSAPGVTIEGTNENETLNGGFGGDTINGLGGDDSINGEGGNDVLRGGDGFDRIDGGFGNDQVFGEGGVDFLNYFAGYDVLDGGLGDDTFTVFNALDGGTLTAIGGEGLDTLLFANFVQMDLNFDGGVGDDKAYFTQGDAASIFVLNMGDGNCLTSALMAQI